MIDNLTREEILDLFKWALACISERKDEAQKEEDENPNDAFKSGRALAYYEMWDILNTRFTSYDNLEDENDTAK